MQNTLQSSFPRYMSAGVVGAPADMHGWDADTRVCEESAGIGFGLAVSQGAADNGAQLGAGLFVGISMRDITLVHDTADQYEQGDNMSVMVRGDIWVLAGTGVVPRQKVYYNSTTGAIGDSGIANAVEIVGAVFLDTGDENDIVRIRLAGAGDQTT